MATRKTDTKTEDLFAIPHPHITAPSSMDFRDSIAELVSEALRDAKPLDRFDIAAKMARLTGKDISKWMLDAYASQAREEFNIPLYLVPAFEAACGTHNLSIWLSTVRGGRLLVGREVLDQELGKLERQQADTNRRIRELKKHMEGSK